MRHARAQLGLDRLDVVHAVRDEGLLRARIVLPVDHGPVELGLRQLDVGAAEIA